VHERAGGVDNLDLARPELRLFCRADAVGADGDPFPPDLAQALCTTAPSVSTGPAAVAVTIKSTALLTPKQKPVVSARSISSDTLLLLLFIGRRTFAGFLPFFIIAITRYVRQKGVERD
jgi:hypothetical protein